MTGDGWRERGRGSGFGRCRSGCLCGSGSRSRSGCRCLLDAQGHAAHGHQHADFVLHGQGEAGGVARAFPPSASIEFRAQRFEDEFVVIGAGDIRRFRHFQGDQVVRREVAGVPIEFRQLGGFRDGGVIENRDGCGWRHGVCQRWQTRQQQQDPSKRTHGPTMPGGIPTCKAGKH